MDTEEVWLVIPQFPLYEASSLGRIRSIPRSLINSRGAHRNVKGKVLAYYQKGDQLMISLRSETSKENKCLAATLILSAFDGVKPKNTRILYADGNKLNIAKSNIQWIDEKVKRQRKDVKYRNIVFYKGELPVKCFVNIKELEHLVGPHIQSRISRAINQGIMFKGFRVACVDDREAFKINLKTTMSNIDFRRMATHNVARKPMAKPVVMCDLNGNKIRDFISLSEAARYIGNRTMKKGCPQCIRDHLKGKYSTAYGYTWKYKN